MAGDQFGTGLENGVHAVAPENELTTHLGGEEGGGQQAHEDVGDEDRKIRAAPHRAPPSRTPIAASRASGTGRAPGPPMGSVQGTPGLHAPTRTLIRVA